MNHKHQRLLSILADGEFHSGESLARDLGITRVAINKAVKNIENAGLRVIAKHGLGYRLADKLELLNKVSIQNALNNSSYDYQLDIVFEIDSTNDEVLKRLKRNEFSHHIVFAELQTKGKGRRNNVWMSPLASGLYFSIGWKMEMANNFTSLMSLLVGVGIIRILRQIGINQAGLKWPNDILVKDRKIGGVLIEMSGEVGGPLQIVIGVGLNYALPNMISDKINQPVTDVCSHLEHPVSRNELASKLVNELVSMFDNSISGDTTSLLDEWRNYDCYLDKAARLILPDSEITGIVKGIDDQGRLLMEHQGEINNYLSGEISLRMTV